MLAHSAGFEQLCSCCLSVGARVPSGLHPQLFLDTVELSSEVILLVAWFGKSYGVSLTQKQLGGGFLVTNLYLDGFLKLCWLLIYSFVSESTGSFLTVSLFLVTRQVSTPNQHRLDKAQKTSMSQSPLKNSNTQYLRVVLCFLFFPSDFLLLLQLPSSS